MRFVFALGVALSLAATAAIAGGDDYGGHSRYDAEYAPPPPRLSLYERISAHYAPLGREVREKFEDGPCRIERHWEKDGDYEERIKCKGPRH